MRWGLRTGISGHRDLLVPRDMSGFSGWPSRAEEGLEGKIHQVVSRGRIRGSWESLAEMSCPVQAPGSKGHELYLGIRQTCSYPKPASS